MTTLYSGYEARHTDGDIIDQEQMNVVFDPSTRLIIEAPAGYGKTKTMVSKIAYFLESNQLPSTKKILTLTFSVNASLNIKNEVLNQLITLYTEKKAINLITQRVVTTNYHGFARHVLSLYGFLIHPNLVHIKQFKIIDETSTSELTDLQVGDDKKEFLKSYANSLKALGKFGGDTTRVVESLNEKKEQYVKILIENFLPNNHLTYNGILILLLELFKNFPRITSFYQSYFPIIFVDEFQDTNWLQWEILCALTGRSDLSLSSRRLYLFGDRLQRIYGFIGAIPKIFDIAQELFQMDLKELKTNHRFAADSKLGKIDRVLRKNADDVRNPQIPFEVEIPVFESNTQTETSQKVITFTKSTLENDSSSTLAILVRNGLSNTTTREILTALRSAQVKFFYALYKEDDQDYIDFHKRCTEIWLNGLRKGIRSIRSMQKFVAQEVSHFPATEINRSLSVLLTLLLEKVKKEYSFLSFEEKSEVIIETLANRGLKQHLDLVTDSRVLLATVHGAKGLQWDYVIMPDVQRFCFPPTPFCFYTCGSCNIDWTKKKDEFEQAFLEELSVFYVAVTRAKKDIVFLFSNRYTFNNGKTQNSPLSCLLKLPGLIRVE